MKFGVALVTILAAGCIGLACQGGGSKAPSGPGDGVVVPGAGTPLPAGQQTTGGGLLLVRDQRLLVRDMATGKERTLRTAPAGFYYSYPRWSPDGSRIAYVVTTVATGAIGQNVGDDIALSKPDGSDEQITVRRPKPGAFVAGLAWTTDGAGLYVSTVVPEQTAAGGLAQFTRLERASLTDGTRTPIATDAAYPTSSPDGSLIAFITYGNDGLAGGLWTARPDGSERKLLVPVSPTLGFAGVRSPQFSPDSARIAFGGVETAAANETAQGCIGGSRWFWQPRVAAAHGPPIDIWAVDAAGGKPAKVAPLAADDPTLAWSPDGSALAVLDTCKFFVIDLGNGKSMQIGDGSPRAQIDWR